MKANFGNLKFVSHCFFATKISFLNTVSFSRLFLKQNYVACTLCSISGTHTHTRMHKRTSKLLKPFKKIKNTYIESSILKIKERWAQSSPLAD